MKLIVFSGANKVHLDLEVGKDLTVGRAPESDVVLRDRKASRSHLRLEWDGLFLKVIDLGSSNGTLLGGKKLKANTPITLEHNDRLEIGEAAIILDYPEAAALVAGAGAARGGIGGEDTHVGAPAREAQSLQAPAGAGARPQAPASAGQAHAASQLPSPPATISRRMRPAPRRSMVSGLVSLAAILAIGVAGVIGFQDMRERQHTRDELARAQAVEASGDLERAIQLYSEFRSAHPNNELAATAHQRMVAIETRERREGEAIEGLAQIQAEAERGAVPATEMSERLSVLIRRYSDTAAASRLRAARDQIGEQVAAERQAAYDDALASIDAALEEGHFAHATILLADLTASYDVSAWKKRLTGIELDIKREAREDFVKLLRRVDEAIHGGQFAEATSVCTSRLNHFAGTPLALDLRRKLATIEVMQKSGYDLALGAPVASAEAIEEVATKNDVFARLAEVDELMLEGKLVEAQAILASAGSSSPETAWRSRGVDAELSLRRKLVNQINAGDMNKPATKSIIIRKNKFVLASADDESVVLSLVTNEGKLSKRQSWSSFSAKEMLGIYRMMNLQPRDRIGIAAYCFRNRLDDLGEEAGPGQAELIRAVKLDAELKGEVEEFYAGVRNMEVPEEGFIAYRKDFMLAPAECADQDLLTDARKSLRKLTELFESTKAQAEGVRSTHWDHIAGISEAATAGGRDRVVEKLRKGVVEAVLPIRHKRVARVKELTDLPAKQKQIMLTLMDKIEDARKHALELIYDEVAYPYDKAKGDHGEKAQPEVDERVGAVRAIWTDPMGAAGEVDPAVRILTRQVREMDRQITRFDPQVVQQEILRLGDDFDLDYLESLANKKLDLKSFANTASDRKRFQKIEAVMEANKEGGVATQLERRQVEVLNEYRIMMGRMPVEICDQLVLAARGHSEYMATTGQFAHVIKGHRDGDTPSERTAKQGYSGGSAENIAMGAGTAEGAHLQWYNSSGHHRNMLSAGHSVMGTGNHGVHWTQNFGSAPCGAVKEQ